MKRYIYIMVSLMCLSLQMAQAQVDKHDVRRGNRDFKKESYREADIDYRKALVKDSTSVTANYNLANTLYRQGDMEQARKMLDRIKDSAPAGDNAADYYFNLGDVAIALQDWQSAVDALEQCLLRSPGDLQAKENYIYAKKKLEEQQQQNQDQDQNDQNQNDQNKKSQNDDGDEKKEQKDGKNDDDDNKQDESQDNPQDKNDQNQDQQKQQSQGEPPKITPQAAQQMLQAIQAKEKETQEKVNKEKAEALKGRQKDKNW
jgi:tetratricopeptide (TPR) repeat protein